MEPRPRLPPEIAQAVIWLEVRDDASRPSKPKFSRLRVEEPLNITIPFHENPRPTTITHAHEVLRRTVALGHGVESHFLTMLPEVLIEVVVVAPCTPEAVAVVNDYRRSPRQHIDSTCGCH